MCLACMPVCTPHHIWARSWWDSWWGSGTAYTLWPHEARHCPASGGTKGPLHQRKVRQWLWGFYLGTAVRILLASMWRSVPPSKDMPPETISDPPPKRPCWMMLEAARCSLFHACHAWCEPVLIYEENGAPMLPYWPDYNTNSVKLQGYQCADCVPLIILSSAVVHVWKGKP